MDNIFKYDIIKGALEHLKESTQAMLARDSDNLKEFSAVEVRKILNRKIDHMRQIFDFDPRSLILPERILTMFADEFHMSDAGTYLLRPGDFDDFCHKLFEKALEMSISQTASRYKRVTQQGGSAE